MARLIPLKAGHDLIVAPATAAAPAAIAIVRASGQGALRLIDQLTDIQSAALEAGKLRLTPIRSAANGEVLDRGLVVGWRGPRSYTGEDLVEFHVHGSPQIVEVLLQSCINCGARLADPGEFTRRAFHAGKMDLAQAEAVALLTNSQTETARRQALSQLDGGLSRRLAAARARLVQVTAELEAAVDYPEEHLPESDSERLAAVAEAVIRELEALIRSHDRGRLLSQGAKLILAGTPNAGKSSLFNALLRRDRAIVTPHPGTTRDTLEAVVELGGLPITLVDTAGLRATEEEVEAIGIQRTRDALPSAALLLYLVDPTAPLDPSFAEYQALPTIPHLLVTTRRDLGPDVGPIAARFNRPERLALIAIDTHHSGDVAKLETAIIDHLAGAPSEDGDATMVTLERHRHALKAAAQALGEVPRSIRTHVPTELVVLDLSLALSHVDSITGTTSLDEDILDVIFSTFCLGK